MKLAVAARVVHDDFTLDVDLTLSAPLSVISGPSGAGKSTLLDVIAGLRTPAPGRVVLDGEDLTDMAPEKRRLGYVFQESLLFDHLSVRKNLDYGRRLRPKEEREDLSRLAERLHLVELLDRSPSTLSGGERRRVAIGRALLSSPRLLLLDEPFAGLNPDLRASVLDTLRDCGVPIVLVTHDPIDLDVPVVRLEAGRVRSG